MFKRYFEFITCYTYINYGKSQRRFKKENVNVKQNPTKSRNEISQNFPNVQYNFWFFFNFIVFIFMYYMFFAKAERIKSEQELLKIEMCKNIKNSIWYDKCNPLLCCSHS